MKYNNNSDVYEILVFNAIDKKESKIGEVESYGLAYMTVKFYRTIYTQKNGFAWVRAVNKKTQLGEIAF